MSALPLGSKARVEMMLERSRAKIGSCCEEMVRCCFFKEISKRYRESQEAYQGEGFMHD